MSDPLPDVVGLPVSEATRILAQAGVAHEVRLTVPRRFGPGAEAAPEAEPRVIQQRPAGAGLLLIAARPLPPPADE